MLDRGVSVTETRLYSTSLPFKGGLISGLILVFHMEISSAGKPPSGLLFKY